MAAPYATERPAVLRLRDPLSDVTRKERRALLGASLLGVALVKTGLLPTEVTALGVKLATSDQRMLLFLLAAVCGYFLIAFLAYAASDYVAWQIALQEALRERIRRSQEDGDDDYEQMMHSEVERVLDERYPWLQRASRYVLPVSRMRASFEFILPVLFAAYAMAVLVQG